MSRVVTTVTGLALGASAALFGLAIAPGAADTTSATTTTSTAAENATAWWVDPFETAIGPAVVIPESLVIDGSEVVFSYRIASIAPAGTVSIGEIGEIPRAVAPESWTLLTRNGSVPGSSRNVSSTEVRFAVDDQFSLGDITGIRLDRYRQRVPYTYQVSLPAQPGNSFVIGTDRYITIDRVLAQATSVIIQLSDDHGEDLFASGGDLDLLVTGVGPEWISSSVRQFGGFQIIREGPEVPDPLVLRVHSTMWLPVTESHILNLEGINGG